MDHRRCPPSPKPRTRLPTEDEIERICLALGYEEPGQRVETKSHQVAVAFLVAIESAMRAGEICSLAWDRVDTEHRTATLEKTKNGHGRQVPLSTKAVELIEQLRGLDPVRVFTVDAGTRDTLFRRARYCGAACRAKAWRSVSVHRGRDLVPEENQGCDDTGE